MAAVARAIIRVLPAAMLGAQKSCARAKNGKFVKFHENIRRRNFAKRTWESKHDETTTGTVSDSSDHADYTTASTCQSTLDQNTGPASNVNITIIVFTTHVPVFFFGLEGIILEILS